MNKTIKNFICILLLVTLIVALAACGNKKVDEPDNEFKPATIRPSTYSSSAYLLDEWRENFDDGSKEYTYSILAYSQDYYAHIDKTNLLYKDNKTIIDQYPSAKIDLIEFGDKEQHQTITLILIKVDQILDTKKIMIDIFGGKKYLGDISDKDEYVNAGGSTEDWCAIRSFLIDKTPPFANFLDQSWDYDSTLMRLYDGNNSLLYIQRNDLVVTDNSIMREFTLTKLTEESNIDAMPVDALEFYPTHSPEFAEDEVEPVEAELPENIEIICELSDDGNIVRYGFKTIDGTSIASYRDRLPKYLVYMLNTSNIMFIDP